MLFSIWRYSHLSLAISSFCFLLVISLTGIILSFDPILEEIEHLDIPKANHQSLFNTLNRVNQEFNSIMELEVTPSSLLKVSGTNKNGDFVDAFVNPDTGKQISLPLKQKAIFKWATSLHRSLFLKSTGRIIVGITSFILLLITFTGTLLIIQRQRGIMSFFKKVIKDNFYEFYHVTLSRLLLIPILIIAFTGVYLSLEKFSLLPKQEQKHKLDYDNISTDTSKKEFTLFKEITLNNFKKLEFPFSEDVEDYYVLQLKNKELYIHQYTGEILSEISINYWKQFYTWSFVTHTGKGSMLWSIVLLASTLSILFFIYSGFCISWQRIKRKEKSVKNKFNASEAEYIILVGSETGSTFTFAYSLYNALMLLKKKTYVCSLNEYENFENIKHLIIITATYGDGEAPKNATHFIDKFSKNPIQKNIPFSVVGFGSTAYPNFCKYAIDIEKFLSKQENLKTQLPCYTINQQAFHSFQQWAKDWGNTLNTSLELKQNKQKTTKYKVIHKTNLDVNDTFMLTLKPTSKNKIISGDLIGIKPNSNEQQRLYSIAIINKNIVLSIKKHTHGLCSNYLFSLEKNNILNGNVLENPSFHLPNNNSKSLLIANGTGIAPFLGMISNNKQKQPIELFLGFKNPDSSKIYETVIQQNLNNKQLEKVNYAYSRTDGEYVQDVLLKNQKKIVDILYHEGVIMICGSIKMRDGVFKSLNKITQNHLQLPLSYFIDLGLIKTDCY